MLASLLFLSLLTTLHWDGAWDPSPGPGSEGRNLVPSSVRGASLYDTPWEWCQVHKKVEGKQIQSAADFAKLLLEKEYVAVVPCADFGMTDYIRLSYATSMELIF